MMTLDEAIKHAEEVADVCEFEASKYDMTDAYEKQVACKEGECANEHRQLAEWLKELKQLREQQSCGDCISRQEAIKICSDRGHDNSAYHISMLPPVTPKTCNDAISRQAVLDATVKKNSIWNKITDSKGENLEEIISQLPSVNPQPKIGHWIHLGGGEYACSECGEVFLTEGSCEKLTDIYCRSCGTTMEESQESEE